MEVVLGKRLNGFGSKIVNFAEEVLFNVVVIYGSELCRIEVLSPEATLGSANVDGAPRNHLAITKYCLGWIQIEKVKR
jgi:hypothetical protein